MGWDSYHIFIHETNLHDVFLVKFFSKFIRKLEDNNLLDKYFYIRYWQGGPHIRFRVKKRGENGKYIRQELNKIFDEFNLEYNNSLILKPEDYYRNHKFDGQPVKKEDLYWCDNRTIVEIPYIPEIDRYGGENVIELSEDLFHISSRLSLLILEKIEDNPNKKIIAALDLFSVAIQILEDKAKFNEIYSSFWAKHRNEKINYSKLTQKLIDIYSSRYHYIKDNLKNIQYNDWYMNLKTILDNIVKNQTKYKTQNQARISILASHIHMMNNRLGVYPQYESMIADVINQVIKKG
ncbi:thiopeptide-type bacteriocin biosynthesis protein [Caloranaerobacter sp. DY30410]|uniref:thiopeptide-type bacteriocin biosynthesis protein n=1 Tax=Caloranaerobacter sp. DY30410 TaxID=3238305 RepID=UPI003D02FF93